MTAIALVDIGPLDREAGELLGGFEEATMSQKSSVPQAAKFVSQALKRDS